MTHPEGPLDDLDDLVREHYEAQALAPDRLAHLKAVASGEVVPEPVDAPTRAWGAWTGAALKLAVAAALLVAAAGPYFGWWGPSKLTPRELAHQIAVEVALNHTKQLELDVNATTWSALAAPHRELEFTPIQPGYLAEYKQLRLLGGRFSTVGGQMALQVRMQDGAGPRSAVYTLYQLRPGETYASLGQKYEFDVHGVRIMIWRERDLILGLARLSPTLH